MWTPTDFLAYRARWPRTPEFAMPEDDRSRAFEAAWEYSAEGLAARLAGVRVVFVRGFLGNLMPGNLKAPVRALRERGVRAELARTATSRTIEHNVALLAHQLEGTEPLILVGHSKGGLECLTFADTQPPERIRAVVMSQTPRGPSAVLESVLEGLHGDSRGAKRALEEWSQRLGLLGVGARAGGLQLTTRPLRERIAQLDEVTRPYPVWQTASWSSQPTTWLDSFHERLGEIRPDCAHDGQFYLEDLIWPGLPHVLLAHVDHAQPAMGGSGFDHARYWTALLGLVARA